MLSHPDRHSGRKRLGITQRVGANQKRVQIVVAHGAVAARQGCVLART